MGYSGVSVLLGGMAVEYNTVFQLSGKVFGTYSVDNSRLNNYYNLS